MAMSEDEPVILGPEHMHILHGLMGFLRQTYISTEMLRNFDPVLTIDYVDIHLPNVPMTLRVPIALDGSFAQQVLDIAPPKRQQVKKVDKLGLLAPPKAALPSGDDNER